MLSLDHRADHAVITAQPHTKDEISRSYFVEVRFASEREMFARVEMDVRLAKEQLAQCKSEEGICKEAEASLDLKLHERYRFLKHAHYRLAEKGKTTSRHTINVVFTGLTGVGKSSLCKLVTQHESCVVVLVMPMQVPLSYVAVSAWELPSSPPSTRGRRPHHARSCVVELAPDSKEVSQSVSQSVRQSVSQSINFSVFQFVNSYFFNSSK